MIPAQPFRKEHVGTPGWRPRDSQGTTVSAISTRRTTNPAHPPGIARVAHDGLVSWKPDWGHLPIDPRLDPYRHRAALLLRGGTEVGFLYAEPEHQVIYKGGHLWWRSFTTPQEGLKLWTRVEGHDDDAWSGGDELAADLHQWSAGVFRLGGLEYECTWLDEAESASIRRELGIPDPA